MKKSNRFIADSKNSSLILYIVIAFDFLAFVSLFILIYNAFDIRDTENTFINTIRGVLLVIISAYFIKTSSDFIEYVGYIQQLEKFKKHVAFLEKTFIDHSDFKLQKMIDSYDLFNENYPEHKTHNLYSTHFDINQKSCSIELENRKNQRKYKCSKIKFIVCGIAFIFIFIASILISL